MVCCCLHYISLSRFGCLRSFRPMQWFLFNVRFFSFSSLKKSFSLKAHHLISADAVIRACINPFCGGIQGENTYWGQFSKKNQACDTTWDAPRDCSSNLRVAWGIFIVGATQSFPGLVFCYTLQALLVVELSTVSFLLLDTTDN